MGRSKYLDPKVWDIVDGSLDMNGEIAMQDAVDLIMPHISCDYQQLKEQLAKRLIRNHMARRKDAGGVRNSFATKRDNASIYIDIDISKELKEVRVVEHQLYEKRKGIVKSHIKAKRRCRELEGQLHMDLLKEDERVPKWGSFR